MKPTCPRCGWIHCARDVMALGRFEPTGPTSYVVARDPERIHPTRAAAEDALCRSRSSASA